MQRRTAIDLNQMYLICEEKSGLPYMDENRCAYLFVDEASANRFLDVHENTKMNPAKFYTESKLYAKLYKLGFLSLSIYKNEEWDNRPIGEHLLKLDYYNNQLSAMITLFKKTKKKKYVTELKKCEFIVPVKIKNGDTPEILYVTAVNPNDKTHMRVAFSDLTEYEQWKGHEEWTPLRVDYQALRQILKGKDLLINPSGNMLLLKHSLLPKTEEEEE